MSRDTHFSPGEPPRHPQGIQLGPQASGPQDPVPRPGLGYRLFVGAVRRLGAAVPVGLFAFAQYGQYQREMEFRNAPEPFWTIGPLYFLTNADPSDDWIAYVLLVLAAPCLLAVVVWPGRWTALLASLTALAWVVSGWYPRPG
jgi:hypothetical protein